MVSKPLPEKTNVPRSWNVPLPPVVWSTNTVVVPSMCLTVCGTLDERLEWAGYVTNTSYVPGVMGGVKVYVRPVVVVHR
jgi:hypothetical protein